MAWDFKTDPEFQEKLDWMETFVRDEIFPLEALGDVWRTPEGRAALQKITEPLKQQVKDQGLWAAHLPPDMGGLGFGQVKLGLMHEILGQTPFGPSTFGNNAPDSGNAELIAVGGTDEQKERWMQPLLDGKYRSCFSMTEPGAGADPTLLTTTAVRDGDEWVINGHKWFSSNASISDFLLVMVKTGDTDDKPYQSFSMIIVPTDTPGVNIVRDVPTMGEPDHKTGEPGGHAEILYDDVRVPFENIIGGEAGIGQGFSLAQKRLGPGRTVLVGALVETLGLVSLAAGLLTGSVLPAAAGLFVIGLGTGSTAKLFVDGLGAKVAAGLDVLCVATSEATQAQALGLVSRAPPGKPRPPGPGF